MKNTYHSTNLATTSLFIFMLFQGSFLGAAFQAVSHDAGKARLFEVMYKGPGGIEEVNKRTLFAETKNITTDLNLLEISSRFGCQTKMGQAFIAYTLEKPVSPHDTNFTVKHRQDLIKFLMEHPELQEKLEVLLTEAVAQEAIAIKFLQGRFVVDPHGNPIKFVRHMMNSNWMYQTYDRYARSMNLLGSPQRIQDKFHKASTSYDTYKLTAQALMVGLTMSRLNDTWKASNDFTWAFNEAVWVPWMTIDALYGFYTYYTEALAIRDSLHAFNRLIDIARQIETMCQEYSIAHQFRISSVRSEQGITLIEDLNHPRYTTKDNYFIFTPAVHSFIYNMHEGDINLAPLYASIAEMDAYLAISKKMTELRTADHTFTFAEYIDADKPTVRAQEFWNTLVSVGDVVTNDISEDRNIILTGSNEGGKTTSIRAILQNIVLAQTFGIAAASKFALTPFDVLHSYLNISDDILHGKSRFASELKQAKDILTQVKSLQPQQKFFFALDELFTGTNGEDGAEAAYRFIDNIAKYSGIQFIYATHFNKLKTIGAENPACVNYKIEPPLRNEDGHFIRDDKGQLIYPYKLSLGANNINVALDRAHDAGIFG